jgi:hypothetical protein
MTTTPEQIEAVAQMRLMIQSAVEDDARAWELTDTELAAIAEAAIAFMRPFIRDEVLEEAAVTCDRYAKHDWQLGEGFRSLAGIELAADIRALKDT